MNKTTLSTNGIIQTIYSELDYSLDFKDRIDRIEKINSVYGNRLLELYTYYKESNLNKYQNRTHYDKICNIYDKLSEYILFSDCEIEKNRNHPYCQESNLKTLQRKNDISLESYVYMMSNNEKRNTKKYDDQNHAAYTLKMFEKKIDECPFVKDYTEYNNHVRSIIEFLDSEIKNLVENGVNINSIESIDYDKYTFTLEQLSTLKRTIGYTKNNSKEIDKDLIYLIKTYFGIFYFKNPLKETERYGVLDLDFMDKDHVAGIIKYAGTHGYSDRFDTYVDKLIKIAKKANLTDFEQEILQTFINGKDIEIDDDKYINKAITVSECSRTLDKKQSKVYNSFNSLVNKICDTYEGMYEDWYYTYIVKGKYKSCSSCGEIKLANERYFGKDDRNKDGCKSKCKECDRKSKKD